jgi:hypothetical protein
LGELGIGDKCGDSLSIASKFNCSPTEIATTLRLINSDSGGTNETSATNRFSVAQSALSLGLFFVRREAFRPLLIKLRHLHMSSGTRIAINCAEPSDRDLVGGLPSMRNVGQAP